MKKYSVLLLIAGLFPSCALTINRDIRKLEKEQVMASLEIPGDESLFNPYFDSLMNKPSVDTMTIQDHNGGTLHIVQAYMDSTGTLVATEMLNPAIIVAKFKNVAERNGEVSIAFDIKIPEKLLDKEWQVRMYPKAVILEDTMNLEPIIISGQQFREKQLRGYELYEKFLSSIITDSSKLLYTEMLDLFIQRNIPELAVLKADSSIIADNTVKGMFGITYSEALNNFRKKLLISKNNRRQNSIPAKYAHYVKEPFEGYGIRMDTVITEYGTELVYGYSERFKTKPGLKKIEIIIDGIIRCDGRELYKIPPTPPLPFYVASFSTLMENKERFITKVIDRKVISKISANICFEPGKYIIDENFDSNPIELATLKHNIAELIDNQVFDIDSLIITTSCSPEGDYIFNRQLSVRRGQSIAEYFKVFVAGYCATADSADREKYGYIMDDESSCYGNDLTTNQRITEFSFAVQNISENWDDLKRLLQNDPSITDKEGITGICDIENREIRKDRLSRHPEYPYILQNLYPQLRNVRFDFHLHRKGMVKDTIHTTVPDTIYQKGLDAIKDRDYQLALKYLGQYKDINSALAYLAMDYNASALKLLEAIPSSGKRDYLLAIAHSRTGNEKAAVQCFINAVGMEPSMAFRGNLDPEISVLIKKYNLIL